MWVALAVIVPELLAKLTTNTTAITEGICVCEGVGEVWDGSVWRLLAMVAAVEVSISGVKMARQERGVTKI